MRMQASELIQHRRDAHHEIALGLPHYTCGVATGIVTVGNVFHRGVRRGGSMGSDKPPFNQNF